MIKPDHLLDQAKGLLQSGPGAPRQANLRRAVSTAYHAVFHRAPTETADAFSGPSGSFGRRGSPRYALIYRSVNHSAMRALCREVGKTSPGEAYRSYWPQFGFGTELREFAETFLHLQEARLAADYDPRDTLVLNDARVLVQRAGGALSRWKNAANQDRDELRTFMTLLIAPPRL